MATHNRAAFTLVELLVVIAIIATLMGLLLPAVLHSRIRAQITQCANYQEELGKAIRSYELDKKHLPGYANIQRGITVNWAVLMLPYIGRTDLWEGGGNDSWRSGNANPNYMKLVKPFVCPADAPTSDCPLSYVVNVGWLDTSVDPDPAKCPVKIPNDAALAEQLGLFRNLPFPGVKSISTSDLKASSRRPMIAERTVARDATYAVNAERQWTENIPANVTALQFGFVWPNTATPVVKPASSSTGVVSPVGALLPMHPGVVNVTFADGSTQQMNDSVDTTCDTFDWANIP